MEEDCVVQVRVVDQNSGDVVFEGKVSADVTVDEFLNLSCFRERHLGCLCHRWSHDVVTSLHHHHSPLDLIASYDEYRFCGGFRFIRCCDHILRSSSSLLSDENDEYWIISTLDMTQQQCNQLFQRNVQHVEIYWSEQMVKIPKSLGNMMMLTSLTLVGLENVKKMPKTLGNLSNLKKLWIESCAFEFLPSSLVFLSQLQHLHLSSMPMLNRISQNDEKINVAFANSLIQLHISHCPNILHFPTWIQNVRSLRYLHLAYLPHFEMRENNHDFECLRHFHMESCDAMLESEASFNGLCRVIRRSLNLKSITIKQWNMGKSLENEETKLLEALKENGSIEEGVGTMLSSCKWIFGRNRVNHERCMRSVVCFVALRKMRRALVEIQKEVVEMVAKMLWNTRCEVNAWIQ